MHDDEYQKAYDKDRQELIEELGFKVLRFKNFEVENNINEVVKIIKQKIICG